MLDVQDLPVWTRDPLTVGDSARPRSWRERHLAAGVDGLGTLRTVFPDGLAVLAHLRLQGHPLEIADVLFVFGIGPGSLLLLELLLMLVELGG